MGVFQDRSVLRGGNPCWMSALVCMRQSRKPLYRGRVRAIDQATGIDSHTVALARPSPKTQPAAISSSGLSDGVQSSAIPPQLYSSGMEVLLMYHPLRPPRSRQVQAAGTPQWPSYTGSSQLVGTSPAGDRKSTRLNS